jgi:predicted LPLAT superfamily acyltransferase
MKTTADKPAPKAHWDGKSYGTVLGYKIFAWCLRVFGIRMAYFLLAWVILYYFLRIKSAHRKAVYRFQRIYNSWQGKGKELGRFYIFQNLYAFGQTLVDRLAIFLMDKKEWTVTDEGAEQLQEIAKTGGIVLSAHIGNWEIGQSLMHAIPGMDCTIAMLVVSDPLHQVVRDNISVISLASQESVAFQLKKALESGQLVLMHGDRFLQGMHTIEVDFMGQPARFPTGPYLIAAILEKDIAFANVMKSGVKSYRFLCTKPRKYQWDASRAKEAQIREWVEEYARFLEDQLRRYPEQWFNFYDFWGSSLKK